MAVLTHRVICIITRLVVHEALGFVSIELSCGSTLPAGPGDYAGRHIVCPLCRQ